MWRDGWGVALLILAVLSMLGVYLHAAGLVGSFLELLFLGLFGVFGLLAPPALAAAGAGSLWPAPCSTPVTRPKAARTTVTAARIAAASVTSACT